MIGRKNFKISVGHLPPGTSKWNKIEHCLFSFAIINWRGTSLRELTTIINLIQSTKTDAGLKIHCVLDQNHCEKGKKISDKVMKDLKIVQNSFRGEWNYRLFH